MFWRQDSLVDALIEKNLARPIPGMEKPDLARAVRLVGRRRPDEPDDQPRPRFENGAARAVAASRD